VLRRTLTLKWAQNGDQLETLCSATDVTIGTLTFRGNVVKDNQGLSSGEQNLVNVFYYGPDALYTDVVTGGKLAFSNNCYFSSAGNALTFGLFGATGTGGCSGGPDRYGSLADNYSGLAAWKAAGYDTGAFNEDPELDAYLKATSENCANKGWNAGLPPAPSHGGGFMPFMQ